MRFERWTVVLTVIAALPAIPAPPFLRAVSVGSSWGTPLYIAALVIAAVLAFRASAREERTREVREGKRDALLAAILEAKSPAELNAKVSELRAEIEHRDTDADGIFR
jgi:hypothetical protein